MYCAIAACLVFGLIGKPALSGMLPHKQVSGRNLMSQADSLEGDPITHLCLSEEAHAAAAAALCGIAGLHGGGRIIGTGGGGYDRRNVARAWTRVVQSLVESA
jgi:hypothetical protein